MFNPRKFFIVSRPDIEAALKDDAALVTRAGGELDQAVAAAAEIPDAGERYLALAAMDGLAFTKWRDLRNAVDGHTDNLVAAPWRHLGVAAGGAACALGFVTIFASAPMVFPVAAIVSLTLFGGALAVGGFSAIAAAMATEGPRKLTKPFAALRESFDEAAHGVRKKASLMQQAIIRDELPGLAASPHFETLYDKVPAIKDAFVKAAVLASRPAVPAAAVPAPATPVEASKPAVPKPE